MDKFAEQLFGRPDKDAKYSAKDGPGLVEGMARTFVKSAASRAMGAASGQRGRGGGFDHDDFRALGGFVLEMLNGDEAERLRKKAKKRRHSERETDRDGTRDGGQDASFEYGNEKRKRRRGHKLSGSPLHDFDYPPVRKRHRRREQVPDPDPDPEPHRSRRHRRHRSHEDRRPRRRHHHRNSRVDLRSLKAELEGMSSTIIGLNARSATHRDCDFYDKFVRKGSRLQDAIGSTLGQIRELGDPDEDEERRERKRRRRERRR
ncbi:hypothetical protein B0J13DRAFT_43114 [Dactylonectria estremocensis]|uniref:Uncharacterized protein n=1 Tax=Dactylonectria estremocensis TaxID=1079267 RepID=A0A9P9ETX1_9HYPO|nr:hypothetical protein B0J13DRAFT_43114 [Dactylonectria estremocensis]